MAVIILTNDPELAQLFHEEIEEETDDKDYEDFYCINIKPFNCVNCGKVIAYAMAGPHLIIVWEHKDDEMLLAIAHFLQKSNYDPRIVTYKKMLGPCVEFEEAAKRGWIEEITHD